ncbi:hypothetical protein [Enterococcus crotali]
MTGTGHLTVWYEGTLVQKNSVGMPLISVVLLLCYIYLTTGDSAGWKRFKAIIKTKD